ncbi:2-C-methyl-D-erythritol 4-phosphate cytidylyltransferase [Roseivirga sp. E12]|uniref:2-C-methyl-D-erythritol 4-phosphate cytidylyltransferase n=1 Tax=Roseivirga sp. E12 TaxID=2819237 RepID=UPI001ABC8FD6|nr:2-C-methyl-D-erythritol 4-phosphate cytidylyltransferase [Roseivirga sp. E12]MBO3700334.1 2-C-methyl-D-erythritol 4-phosphate cytidylyltransferase [Roseivirga sp. E12]
MRKYAIIVAGGSGTRMLSELPKQFLLLNGRPILMHTIEAFNFDGIRIVLVLPEQQIQYWKTLCEKYSFRILHNIIQGGETRFNSVKNGLNSIEDKEGLVAIHDGVRPLIDRSIISMSFTQAESHGNAITSVSLKDSLREVSSGSNRSVDRAAFRLIQTPQTFQLDLIKTAFEVPFQPTFTDDASVFENSGKSIHLIDGDYRNIKITTPEDLLVVESFLVG